MAPSRSESESSWFLLEPPNQIVVIPVLKVTKLRLWKYQKMLRAETGTKFADFRSHALSVMPSASFYVSLQFLCFFAIRWFPPKAWLRTHRYWSLVFLQLHISTFEVGLLNTCRFVLNSDSQTDPILKHWATLSSSGSEVSVVLSFLFFIYNSQ